MKSTDNLLLAVVILAALAAVARPSIKAEPERPPTRYFVDTGSTNMTPLWTVHDALQTNADGTLLLRLLRDAPGLTVTNFIAREFCASSAAPAKFIAVTNNVKH